MVIEREGNGWPFMIVAEKEGIDLRDFRTIKLIAGSDRERLFMGAIKEEPSVDEASFLLRNVTNFGDVSLNVLLVPREAKELVADEVRNVGERPQEDECFMIIVWNRDDPSKQRKILAVASEPQLENIAKYKGQALLKCRKSKIGYSFRDLDPDEFILEAKKLIDRGIRLPYHILRFGDLLAYHKSRRGNSEF